MTVLRRGRVVGEADPDEVGSETLVAWIAGEEPRPVERRPVPAGEILLGVRGLSCGSGPSAPKGVDLTVRSGQIVGIGGVLGNGQTEIVRALTGQIPLREGSVRIFDQRWKAPEHLILPDEVAWIPDDRRGEGLALEMTCEENLQIGIAAGLAPRGEDARRRLEVFDVRPADPSLRVSHLSGGNQQRLLLAREMARIISTSSPPIAIVSEPSPGHRRLPRRSHQAPPASTTKEVR